MTLDQFWQLIEESRAAGPDQVYALEKEVLNLPPREMISFEGHCWDLLSLSFRRELWAAAAVIEPDCSQGSFDAMRAWLILEGREFFEQAVARPEVIAGRVPNPSSHWRKHGERLLEVVPRNYRKLTGEEMPTVPRKVPYVIKGQRWVESDLPDMYPSLWRKYRTCGNAQVAG